jgi:hypothetical protein
VDGAGLHTASSLGGSGSPARDVAASAGGGEAFGLAGDAAGVGLGDDAPGTAPDEAAGTAPGDAAPQPSLDAVGRSTQTASGDDAAVTVTLDVHRASDAPTPPMARRGRLLLRAPVVDPVLVGFHEAANPYGFALHPVGELLAHRNPTRYDAPPNDPSGTPYVVLASRGEPAPATSAIDVVLVDDQPVLAPVSGVVSDVRSFTLYGRYADQRVEIVPRGAPHLRVVLIHLEEVRVAPGDAVVVGRSVLATGARRFPFASQIDRETEPDVWPHVHVEVQRVGAPRPGDPPPTVEETDDDAG